MIYEPFELTDWYHIKSYKLVKLLLFFYRTIYSLIR